MPKSFVLSLVVTVDAPLFGGLLSSTKAAMVAYACPALGMLLLIVNRLNPTRRLAVVVGALLVISALFLHQHILFFDSADNLVLFWTSIWILWLGSSLYSDRKSLRFEAEWLVKATVVFIFLGAAVGKWTGAYWRGDPLMDMWTNYSHLSWYPWVRYIGELEQLEVLVQFHSRLAVICETLFALTIFLRFRYFTIAFLALVAGMIASVDYTILAPMLPMFALVVGCYLIPDRAAEDEGSTSSTPSFRVLMSMYGVLAAVIMMMSFTPYLQREWMKQSHLTTESSVGWRVIHLFPKMYSFENKSPYIENFSEAVPAEGEAEAFPLQRCTKFTFALVNHYPSNIIRDAHCHGVFMTHQGPVTLVFESRYRSVCVTSRLAIHATIEDGERMLRVESKGSHFDC